VALRAPARERAHARDELRKHERLAQIIVRAQVQAIDPVLDLHRSGEHEDPRPAAGKRSTHLAPGNDRQVTVEHDHVICGLRGGLHCGGAVVHGVDRQPGLTESLRDPTRKGRMILDHQHPHLSEYAPRRVTFVRPRR
jgi:hypothetical protein